MTLGIFKRKPKPTALRIFAEELMKAEKEWAGHIVVERDGERGALRLDRLPADVAARVIKATAARLP